MQEDSEILDWDAEAESRGASRKASYDQSGPREDSGDEDDPEDAVSLGDEEDQAFYYHSGDAITNNHGQFMTKESFERPPSAQRRVDTLGANDRGRSQDVLRDSEYGAGFTNQSSNTSQESPPGRRSSKNQRSPQPQQANITRLTHALPPKPVMVNAALLTPSQSSIAQATRMTSMSPRTAAREAKKLPPAPAKPAPDPELPPGWEVLRSRESDQLYYHNKDTKQSQWDPPVSNLPSSSSRGASHSRHRPTGGRCVSPSDSDPPHSQTSRPNLHSSRVPPENEPRETIRSRTPDPDNLSYKDRHYRPGEVTSVTVEVRSMERSEVLSGRFPSKSRYDRSSSKSPTRQRRRPRSNSPSATTRPPPEQHSRDQDYPSSRGNARLTDRERRNSYTNADSSMQRDHEIPQPQAGHTGRKWIPSSHIPPADFSGSDLDTRRPPYRTPDEGVRMLDEPPADNRNRPAPRRRTSSREPRRDREPPRHDMREQLNGQSFASAPRNRSPPPRERDQGRDHVGYQDNNSAPLPNRKEMSSRFDRSLSSNGPPQNGGGPPLETRPRDYDARPVSNFERHRIGEREYVRPHRDFPEIMEQPRRKDAYLPDAARSLDRSRRYQEEPSRPIMQDGSQSSQIKRRPLPPQTHTFMTSSATGPVYRDPPPHSIANPPGRDMDTRGKLLDSSNPPRRPRRGSISPSRAENRGGIPRQHDAGRSSNLHPHVPPGVETHMDVDPEHLERSSYIPSPSIPRGSRPQVEERFELPEGPRSSRPPPPKPTVPMDFHPGFPQGPNSSDYTNFGPQSRPVPSAYGTSRYDQKRTDGYPDRDQGQSERRPAMAHGDRGGPPPRRDVRTRPEGLARQPPPHISGTNNIPIGVRRGAGPPSNPPLPLASDGLLNSPLTVFNPDARPPPSTLINPGKGRELLVGKESYERPQGMPVPDDRPRRMSLSESQPQRRSPPPHQVLSLPPKPQALPSRPITVPEQQQRRMDRKTRFSQAVPPSDRNRMTDRLNNSSEREYPSDIIQRHVSPPLSREPSMMSSSARHSDRGHSPDGRSDNSRNGVQERDGIVPAMTSASQETGSFNPELLMNASLRRVGSRLGDYDKPRYATTLGPYQYFMDDEPQPNLSRRLSLEKPPRHRKYRSGSLNDGEMTAPVGQIEPSPQSLGGRELQDDKSMDFKDRVEKVPHPAQRQGAPISLLERLSSAEDMGQASTGSEQSLRDRLVPSKRDRDDMMNDGDGRERSYDGEDGYDSKRVKRRSGKGRRGGGRR